ncbi:MAG: hypothetical protein ACHQ0J_07830 [Candidatus Dormibacterales bacterium]
MQRAKPEPEDGKCKCGRPRHDASIYTYRSAADRYVFHRCECGTEWTEHLADVDPTEPVSSDEVIEVHKRLAQFEGSIAELIEKHLA